jgi:hypothetical protein
LCQRGRGRACDRSFGRLQRRGVQASLLVRVVDPQVRELGEHVRAHGDGVGEIRIERDRLIQEHERRTQ